jgi:SAM-dependent methyltransferase
VYRIVVAVLAGLALVTVVADGQQRQQHGRLFSPENLALLEAPDRDVWQRPEEIMDALLIGEGSVVADLGAGSGWFTIRLARRETKRQSPRRGYPAPDDRSDHAQRATGKPEQYRRRQAGHAEDPHLPVGALDAVLVVDAYHEMEQPVALLRNVARALKPAQPPRPGGRVGIVDFTMAGGGFGPPMDERVDPER